MINVILIGCVEFTYKMLNVLITTPFVRISGLVTKSSSKFNSDFYSLEEIAASNHIPTFFYENETSLEKMRAWIAEKQPTVLFCLGWSHLLPKEILNIGKYGTIGYHPAALPQNRGRHPIVWALSLGLEQTASTFFQIDVGADSGDIIEQQFVTINYIDNARSLYNKLTEIACIQLKNICLNIQKSCLKLNPQSNENSSYWRKRTEKDGCIDWRMPSIAIYNLVRALSEPYPGAHFIFQNEKVLVWEVEEVCYTKQDNLIPGMVLDVFDKKILIKTYGSAILLLKFGIIKEFPKVGEYLL